MDKQKRDLIQAIHDAPDQLVYVAAGAGTTALSDLLGVAGASRTLLEAVVPYSEAAFCDFLGAKPKQYVHPKAAKLLAGRAFTRAKWLAENGTPVVGVSCTATIATDRPKRGKHRAHIALWQQSRLHTIEVVFKKELRTREGEETAVSHLILNALAVALELPYQLETGLTEQDSLKQNTISFAKGAQRLHDEQVPFLGVYPHGVLATKNVSPQLLLSGSFNPLHEGHLELAHTASELAGMPIAFEISAFNVDKPPLPVEKMLQRLGQFAGRWPVYLTNAPTFLDKSRLFPGCTFVVGVDTAVRILDPKYYNDSPTERDAALQEILAKGGQFLVAGRVSKDGQFRELADIDIPEPLAPLFQPIPADQFREDISSTELRQNNKKGSR